MRLNFDRNAVDYSGLIKNISRPDFLCWLDDVLIFWGEEKSSYKHFNDAKGELEDKVANPGAIKSLNFNFAYAAGGHLLQYVLIFFMIYNQFISRLNLRLLTRFFAMRVTNKWQPITQVFNLDEEVDRVRVVIVMMKVFQYFKAFHSELCQ